MWCSFDGIVGAPVKVLFDVGDLRETGEFVESFTGAVRDAVPEVLLSPIVFSEPSNPALAGPRDWESLEFFSIKGVLASRASLESVDHFVRFQSSPSFGSVRFVALKLLNRIDFTGTFRFLEREVILHSAILAALDLLLRLEPRLIVFRVTPHEFLQFVVAEVAKYLDIEVLHFQPCSLAPVMIPRYSSGMRFDFERVSRDAQENDFVLETARAQLRTLREERPPTYMVLQSGRDLAVRSFPSRLRALRSSIGWIFHDRFPTSVDFSGHSNPKSLVHRLLKVLLTRSLQRELTHTIRRVGRDSLPTKPFALLALHYEPERTSLPDGLPIEFQGDAVLQARAFLPPEIELVIKEHYSQQSSALRGFLGRSPLFYDLIGHLPGTSFVGYDKKLTSLVPGALCVFTLTGTIAIEAVLKGVPVVYFGAPWWGGMPGTFRLGDGQSFSTVLREGVPEPREIWTFLENLVVNCAIPGFASESIDTIVKRFGAIPKNFPSVEGIYVARCIAALDSPR